MKEDDVVVVSSDSEEEEEIVWMRKNQNKQYQLLWDKIKPILYYQVQPGYKLSTSFPYARFQELANDLKKSLTLVNVKSTQAFIWKNVIRWLLSIKLCYENVSDCMNDKNYNLILTDFMAQYVNYKCQLYSSINDETEVKVISNEIVVTLNLVFSGWVPGIVMTLLKIQVIDDYKLILYPIFRKYLSNKHLHQTNDLISYLRLILCFRKWKKLAHLKEDKEIINEIAVGKSAKSLRSDIIDLSTETSDIEPVLPKTVPSVNEDNRSFANITGLIGFAAKNQEYGTRILLINKTMELDDTIEQFFKRYNEYINRRTPKLLEWSRADLKPTLIEDLTRSPSPDQLLPKTSCATPRESSQIPNKNKINEKQGTKAVHQHLSNNCDISSISVNNKFNNLNLNNHTIENLSPSCKNIPQNRNNELSLKINNVVDFNDTNNEESNNEQNSSVSGEQNSNAQPLSAFEKRLAGVIDRLKNRAIIVGDLVNRVNVERNNNPAVAAVSLDETSQSNAELPVAQVINNNIEAPLPVPMRASVNFPNELSVEKPIRKRHGIVSSTTSFEGTGDDSDNSDDDDGFGTHNRFPFSQRSYSKVVEEATSSTNEIPKTPLNFTSQPRRSISSSPCPTRPSSPSPDRWSNISPSSTIRSGSSSRLEIAAGISIAAERTTSFITDGERPTCSRYVAIPMTAPSLPNHDETSQKEKVQSPSLENLTLLIDKESNTSNNLLESNASASGKCESEEEKCFPNVLPSDHTSTRADAPIIEKLAVSEVDTNTGSVNELLKNISGFIGDLQEEYGFESSKNKCGPDKSPREIFKTSTTEAENENESNNNPSSKIVDTHLSRSEAKEQITTKICDISFEKELDEQVKTLKILKEPQESNVLPTAIKNSDVTDNTHNFKLQENSLDTSTEDATEKELIEEMQTESYIEQQAVEEPIAETNLLKSNNTNKSTEYELVPTLENDKLYKQPTEFAKMNENSSISFDKNITNKIDSMEEFLNIETFGDNTEIEKTKPVTDDESSFEAIAEDESSIDDIESPPYELICQSETLDTPDVIGLESQVVHNNTNSIDQLVENTSAEGKCGSSKKTAAVENNKKNFENNLSQVQDLEEEDKLKTKEKVCSNIPLKLNCNNIFEPDEIILTNQRAKDVDIGDNQAQIIDLPARSEDEKLQIEEIINYDHDYITTKYENGSSYDNSKTCSSVELTPVSEISTVHNYSSHQILEAFDVNTIISKQEIKSNDREVSKVPELQALDKESNSYEDTTTKVYDNCQKVQSFEDLPAINDTILTTTNQSDAQPYQEDSVGKKLPSTEQAKGKGNYEDTPTKVNDNCPEVQSFQDLPAIHDTTLTTTSQSDAQPSQEDSVGKKLPSSEQAEGDDLNNRPFKISANLVISEITKKISVKNDEAIEENNSDDNEVNEDLLFERQTSYDESLIDKFDDIENKTSDANEIEEDQCVSLQLTTDRNVTPTDKEFNSENELTLIDEDEKEHGDTTKTTISQIEQTIENQSSYDEHQSVVKEITRDTSDTSIDVKLNCENATEKFDNKQPLNTKANDDKVDEAIEKQTIEISEDQATKHLSSVEDDTLIDTELNAEDLLPANIEDEKEYNKEPLNISKAINQKEVNKEPLLKSKSIAQKETFEVKNTDNQFVTKQTTSDVNLIPVDSKLNGEIVLVALTKDDTKNEVRIKSLKTFSEIYKTNTEIIEKQTPNAKKIEQEDVSVNQQVPSTPIDRELNCESLLSVVSEIEKKNGDTIIRHKIGPEIDQIVETFQNQTCTVNEINEDQSPFGEITYERNVIPIHNGENDKENVSNKEPPITSPSIEKIDALIEKPTVDIKGIHSDTSLTPVHTQHRNETNKESPSPSIDKIEELIEKPTVDIKGIHSEAISTQVPTQDQNETNKESPSPSIERNEKLIEKSTMDIKGIHSEASLTPVPTQHQNETNKESPNSSPSIEKIDELIEKPIVGIKGIHSDVSLTPVDTQHQNETTKDSERHLENSCITEPPKLYPANEKVIFENKIIKKTSVIEKSEQFCKKLEDKSDHDSLSSTKNASKMQKSSSTSSKVWNHCLEEVLTSEVLKSPPPPKVVDSDPLTERLSPEKGKVLSLAASSEDMLCKIRPSQPQKINNKIDAPPMDNLLMETRRQLIIRIAKLSILEDALFKRKSGSETGTLSKTVTLDDQQLKQLKSAEKSNKYQIKKDTTPDEKNILKKNKSSKKSNRKKIKKEKKRKQALEADIFEDVNKGGPINVPITDCKISPKDQVLKLNDSISIQTGNKIMITEENTKKEQNQESKIEVISKTDNESSTKVLKEAERAECGDKKRGNKSHKKSKRKSKKFSKKNSCEEEIKEFNEKPIQVTKSLPEEQIFKLDAFVCLDNKDEAIDNSYVEENNKDQSVSRQIYPDESVLAIDTNFKRKSDTGEYNGKNRKPSNTYSIIDQNDEPIEKQSLEIEEIVKSEQFTVEDTFSIDTGLNAVDDSENMHTNLPVISPLIADIDEEIKQQIVNFEKIHEKQKDLGQTTSNENVTPIQPQDQDETDSEHLACKDKKEPLKISTVNEEKVIFSTTNDQDKRIKQWGAQNDLEREDNLKMVENEIHMPKCSPLSSKVGEVLTIEVRSSSLSPKVVGVESSREQIPEADKQEIPFHKPLVSSLMPSSEIIDKSRLSPYQQIKDEVYSPTKDESRKKLIIRIPKLLVLKDDLLKKSTEKPSVCKRLIFETLKQQKDGEHSDEYQITQERSPLMNVLKKDKSSTKSLQKQQKIKSNKQQTKGSKTTNFFEDYKLSSREQVRTLPASETLITNQIIFTEKNAGKHNKPKLQVAAESANEGVEGGEKPREQITTKKNKAVNFDIQGATKHSLEGNFKESIQIPTKAALKEQGLNLDVSKCLTTSIKTLLDPVLIEENIISRNKNIINLINSKSDPKTKRGAIIKRNKPKEEINELIKTPTSVSNLYFVDKKVNNKNASECLSIQLEHQKTVREDNLNKDQLKKNKPKVTVENIIQHKSFAKAILGEYMKESAKKNTTRSSVEIACTKSSENFINEEDETNLSETPFDSTDKRKIHSIRENKSGKQNCNADTVPLQIKNITPNEVHSLFEPVATSALSISKPTAEIEMLQTSTEISEPVKRSSSKNTLKSPIGVSSVDRIAKKVKFAECQTEPKSIIRVNDQLCSSKCQMLKDSTGNKNANKWQSNVLQNIVECKDELIKNRNQEVFSQIRLAKLRNSIEPDSSSQVATELQRTENTLTEEESNLSTRVQVADLGEPSFISDSEISQQNALVALESDKSIVFYPSRDSAEDHEVSCITSQKTDDNIIYYNYNDENGTPVMDEKNSTDDASPSSHCKITSLSKIKVPTADVHPLTPVLIIPQIIKPTPELNSDPKEPEPKPISIDNVELLNVRPDETVSTFWGAADENLELWLKKLGKSKNCALNLNRGINVSNSNSVKLIENSLENQKNDRKQKKPRRVQKVDVAADADVNTNIADQNPFNFEDYKAAAILTSLKTRQKKVHKSRKLLQPTRITRSATQLAESFLHHDSEEVISSLNFSENLCEKDPLDNTEINEKCSIPSSIQNDNEVIQSNLSSCDSDDTGKLVIDLDAKKLPKSKTNEKSKSKRNRKEKGTTSPKTTLKKNTKAIKKLSFNPIVHVIDENTSCKLKRCRGRSRVSKDLPIKSPEPAIETRSRRGTARQKKNKQTKTKIEAFVESFEELKSPIENAEHAENKSFQTVNPENKDELRVSIDVPHGKPEDPVLTEVRNEEPSLSSDSESHTRDNFNKETLLKYLTLRKTSKSLDIEVKQLSGNVSMVKRVHSEPNLFQYPKTDVVFLEMKKVEDENVSEKLKDTNTTADDQSKIISKHDNRKEMKVLESPSLKVPMKNIEKEIEKSKTQKQLKSDKCIRRPIEENNPEKTSKQPKKPKSKNEEPSTLENQSASVTTPTIKTLFVGETKQKDVPSETLESVCPLNSDNESIKHFDLAPEIKTVSLPKSNQDIDKNERKEENETAKVEEIIENTSQIKSVAEKLNTTEKTSGLSEVKKQVEIVPKKVNKSAKKSISKVVELLESEPSNIPPKALKINEERHDDKDMESIDVNSKEKQSTSQQIIENIAPIKSIAKTLNTTEKTSGISEVEKQDKLVPKRVNKSAKKSISKIVEHLESEPANIPPKALKINEEHHDNTNIDLNDNNSKEKQPTSQQIIENIAEIKSIAETLNTTEKTSGLSEVEKQDKIVPKRVNKSAKKSISKIVEHLESEPTNIPPEALKINEERHDDKDMDSNDINSKEKQPTSQQIIENIAEIKSVAETLNTTEKTSGLSEVEKQDKMVPKRVNKSAKKSISKIVEHLESEPTNFPPKALKINEERHDDKDMDSNDINSKEKQPTSQQIIENIALIKSIAETLNTTEKTSGFNEVEKEDKIVPKKVNKSAKKSISKMVELLESEHSDIQPKALKINEEQHDNTNIDLNDVNLDEKQPNSHQNMLTDDKLLSSDPSSTIITDTVVVDKPRKGLISSIEEANLKSSVSYSSVELEAKISIVGLKRERCKSSCESEILEEQVEKRLKRLSLDSQLSPKKILTIEANAKDLINLPQISEEEEKEDLPRVLDIFISNILGNQLSNVSDSAPINGEEVRKQDSDVDNKQIIKKSLEIFPKRKRPSLGFRRRRSNSTSDVPNILASETFEVAGCENDQEAFKKKSESEAKKARVLSFTNLQDLERDFLLVELNAENFNDTREDQSSQGLIAPKVEPQQSVQSLDCMFSGNRGQDDEDKLLIFNTDLALETVPTYSPDENVDLYPFDDYYSFTSTSTLMSGSENVSGGNSDSGEKPKKEIKKTDFTPKENETMSSSEKANFEEERSSSEGEKPTIDVRTPEYELNEGSTNISCLKTKLIKSPIVKLFQKTTTPEKKCSTEETAESSKLKSRPKPFWKKPTKPKVVEETSVSRKLDRSTTVISLSENPFPIVDDVKSLSVYFDEIFEEKTTKTLLKSETSVTESNSYKVDLSKKQLLTNLSTDDRFDRLKSESPVNTYVNKTPTPVLNHSLSVKSDDNCPRDLCSKRLDEPKTLSISFVSTIPSISTDLCEQKDETNKSLDIKIIDQSISSHSAETTASYKQSDETQKSVLESNSLEKANENDETKKSYEQINESDVNLRNIVLGEDNNTYSKKPIRRSRIPSDKKSPEIVSVPQINKEKKIEKQTYSKHQPSKTHPSAAAVSSMPLISTLLVTRTVLDPCEHKIIDKDSCSKKPPLRESLVINIPETSDKTNTTQPIPENKIDETFNSSQKQISLLSNAKKELPSEAPCSEISAVSAVAASPMHTVVATSPMHTATSGTPKIFDPCEHKISAKDSCSEKIPEGQSFVIKTTDPIKQLNETQTTPEIKIVELSKPSLKRCPSITNVTNTHERPSKIFRSEISATSVSLQQQVSPSSNQILTGNLTTSSPNVSNAKVPTQNQTMTKQQVGSQPLPGVGVSAMSSLVTSTILDPCEHKLSGKTSSSKKSSKQSKVTKSPDPIINTNKTKLTPEKNIVETSKPSLKRYPSCSDATTKIHELPSKIFRSDISSNSHHQVSSTKIPYCNTTTSSPNTNTKIPARNQIITKSSMLQKTSSTIVATNPTLPSQKSIEPELQLSISLPSQSTKTSSRTITPVHTTDKAVSISFRKSTTSSSTTPGTSYSDKPRSTSTPFGTPRSNNIPSSTPRSNHIPSSTPRSNNIPSSTPRSNHIPSSTQRSTSSISSTSATRTNVWSGDLARVSAEVENIKKDISKLPKVDYKFTDFKRRKFLLQQLESKEEELNELKKKIQEYEKHTRVSKSYSERKAIDRDHQQHLQQQHQQRSSSQQSNDLKRKHDQLRPHSERQFSKSNTSGHSFHVERQQNKPNRGYVNKFSELDKFNYQSADTKPETKKLPPWDPKPMNADEIIRTLRRK